MQGTRVAEALQVDAGYERAVETVLGDYLEAVCVEGLDAITASLEGLAGTHLAIFENTAANGAASPVGTLAAHVRGPQAVLELLADRKSTRLNSSH